MLRPLSVIISAFLIMGGSISLQAEERMFENFESQPAERWEFLADTVMGGVSTGKIDFTREGDTSFVRLTGSVSTANNGGFIQVRRKLDSQLSKSITGIQMVVRGNTQKYFIHLRTKGTVLPWQYYQSGFETETSWTEVRLPLTSFDPSGRLLRKTPAAASITSIGILAYGRDHKAQIDVRQIDFY